MPSATFTDEADKVRLEALPRNADGTRALHRARALYCALSRARRNDRNPARFSRRAALARSAMKRVGANWRAGEADMFACTILTLFPTMFPGPLGQSLAGDALARSLWSLEARDIRRHGLGRHRAGDDTPAGGGPGVGMRADVRAASLAARLPPCAPPPPLI